MRACRGVGEEEARWVAVDCTEGCRKARKGFGGKLLQGLAAPDFGFKGINLVHQRMLSASPVINF